MLHNPLSQEAQSIVDAYLDARRAWFRLPPRARSRLRPNPAPVIEFSTQADWRAIGSALRARFIGGACDRCDCYQCRRGHRHTKRSRRVDYWTAVMSNLIRGDSSALIKHLKSGRALTQFDRRILADSLDAFLKGELHTSPSVGRPKNIPVQGCASTALGFYDDWKTINRQCKIKDWGHSEEMKDEACRVAIDCQIKRVAALRRAPTHPIDMAVPDFEQVRELMDRPRSQSRPRESEQGDKWSFCLTAGTLCPANQERQ
jgi:hypothetical protein